MSTSHYHIKQWADVDRKYSVVFKEREASLAHALARCAVLASIERQGLTTPPPFPNDPTINFYPLLCEGDYCIGERSYGPLPPKLAHSGNALRPTTGRGKRPPS